MARSFFSPDDEPAVMRGPSETARRSNFDRGSHRAAVSIDSYDFVCRCIGEQRRAVSIEKISTMPSRKTSINVGRAGFWYQSI